MCGIAGLVDLTASSSGEVLDARARAMASRLVHRGPDDEGIWIDPAAGIALGFRRLSIIDLSAEGHQPMVSRSGRYVLAFNGEIYNHSELRHEFERKGVPFRGRSDTEVLLEAIEAWGIGRALTRSNGMFAIACWDRRERRLSLARDRIGEKPLFYAGTTTLLGFGSELKTLSTLAELNLRIDHDAIADYLRFGHIPGPRTIYAGVRQVRPGTIVSFDISGADPKPKTDVYWSAATVYENRPSAPRQQDAVDELDALLRTAVESRMHADVPLGAFLSGGIDSSMVVAAMTRASSRPVRTFTIGFAETTHDEASHARQIAEQLGTNHMELYVTPDDALQLIPSLPDMFDEPFGDSSAIPTALLARLTRRHVTVSLSGDGGDELFGGYDRYVRGRRLWALANRAPRPVRYASAAALRAPSTASYDRVAGAMARSLRRAPRPDIGHKAHRLAQVLTARSGDDLYRQIISNWQEPQTLVTTTPRAEARLTMPTGLNFTEQMMFCDLVGYLPDDILVKLDRATMAASLEARVPLLDHRVVEYAWRLPVEYKITGASGKQILRHVLARYLPRDLFERPKMGFAIPIDAWLRGPLRTWGDDLLSPAQLRMDGLLDPDAIQNIWRAHQDGTRNWQYPLWAILMLQSWLVQRRESARA